MQPNVSFIIRSLVSSMFLKRTKHLSLCPSTYLTLRHTRPFITGPSTITSLTSNVPACDIISDAC